MMDATPDSGRFTIAAESIAGADATAALEQYVAELAQVFPAGFDPGRAAPPEPGDFAPPRGRFLLVRDAAGAVRGCGAVRVLEPGIAEIRRMWISPVLRGRGAGRALLAELERSAAELGCGVVRLDTAAELHAARALYGSAGYAEIPAYNDNEYARHWFEKVLG
ncbi:GNAT family N-acetyltransferase [Saccharopolyspora sp. 6T]|uniref:GNAT family N-acetyltransferase n=1 Tax=Saccharopolyspora sp. 6T TaxID=2877238 RepID=UPI001CD4BA0B|nr:GNAT family N-acetyltransferase [Saccharopolyspora sp. 6T]MCA1186794.1 GNAT family N-acetyltransferase [Saccharopolyspora sp. 6T]